MKEQEHARIDFERISTQMGCICAYRILKAVEKV
jgi:hypothetical protein